MGVKSAFFAQTFLPVKIFLPAQAGKSFLPVNRFTGNEIGSLSHYSWDFPNHQLVWLCLKLAADWLPASPSLPFLESLTEISAGRIIHI